MQQLLNWRKLYQIVNCKTYSVKRLFNFACLCVLRASRTRLPYVSMCLTFSIALRVCVPSFLRTFSLKHAFIFYVPYMPSSFYVLCVTLFFSFLTCLYFFKCFQFLTCLMCVHFFIKCKKTHNLLQQAGISKSEVELTKNIFIKSK